MEASQRRPRKAYPPSPLEASLPRLLGNIERVIAYIRRIAAYNRLKEVEIIRNGATIKMPFVVFSELMTCGIERSERNRAGELSIWKELWTVDELSGFTIKIDNKELRQIPFRASNGIIYWVMQEDGITSAACDHEGVLALMRLCVALSLQQ